jgi:hypothetical protein
VDRAVKETIRALDLQTEMPEAIDKAAKDSIHSLDLQTELPRRADPVHIPLSIPEWVLWAVLAVVVGLLLYAFRDQIAALLGGRQAGWEPPPPGVGEIAIGREHDTLAAADRLSREGNFVEAMHILLLHSVEEIRRQLGTQFAVSLTSREILRVARLTAAARAALRDIVGAVERTYFGAYPASAGDYASCRQNFETLQQALHDGAPA